MNLFGEEHATPVLILGKELRCLVCDGDLFWQREGMLNTASAMFLNFAWANPRVTCVICAFCGFIHWFAPLKKLDAR